MRSQIMNKMTLMSGQLSPDRRNLNKKMSTKSHFMKKGHSNDCNEIHKLSVNVGANTPNTKNLGSSPLMIKKT